MYKYLYRSIKDKKMAVQQKKRIGSWIIGEKLTQTDIDALVERHGFDPDVLDDALDYFEVPRFESSRDIPYFFTRYPVNTADGEASTAPVMVAISNDYLATLFNIQAPAFVARLQKRDQSYTTQRVRFFLEFMEELATDYEKNLSSIRKETTRYFGNFHAISDSEIEHFVGLESTVTDYISALSPTKTALKRMLASPTIVMHPEDVDLVEDLTQDIDQLIETARSLQLTIQNIRDAYSTILTNKLNRTIRFLTTITIVLTMPTLIASMFGMNTWVPFGNDPISFLYVILTMLVATALFGLLVVIRR